MKKLCFIAVIVLFTVLGLVFPITDLAFDTPKNNEDKLLELENKFEELDKKLSSIENSTYETYYYIYSKQHDLAKKVNTSVDIVQIIEKVSRKYDIPFELAFEVARLESNFNPGLTNYNEWNDTHDRGLFQLNDNTSPWLAKKVGINNFNYEMAYNPELNTNMGLWYLSYLYGRYNNWHDTLTAYNRGINGLEKFKERTGSSRSTYSRRILDRTQK
jgi:soluble lytic murein transglycosylase-like protein